MTKQEFDKKKLTEWLWEHAQGFRNAKHKKDILMFFAFNERVLRKIMSELKHEGLVFSTSTWGYWYREENITDHAEIEAMKNSLLETRSRAMSQLEHNLRQLKEVEELGKKINQGQGELFA